MSRVEELPDGWHALPTANRYPTMDAWTAAEEAFIELDGPRGVVPLAAELARARKYASALERLAALIGVEA